jgi:hypothetical protein
VNPPKVGWVRLTTTDPPLTLVVRLSAEHSFVAGYGGWNQISRPRRPPLSVWSGEPGMTMTLGVLFNHFRSGELSVEAELATLEKMAQPTGSDGQPPRVIVEAAGGAIPHQAKQWVINDLVYGDAIMNWNGNRCRQQVTVTLLEYVAVVYLRQKSAAKRQRAKAAAQRKAAGAAQKRVQVRRSRKAQGAVGHSLSLVSTTPDGEDLLTIAARELGDADRWVEIAELNGIRDPRSLVTGQVILLP